VSGRQCVRRTPTSAAATVMIVVALAGVGCSSSGNSDKAAITSAASVPFPVVVGSTWKYKLITKREVMVKGKATEDPVSGTETDEVAAVVTVPGGQKVTMIHTWIIPGVPSLRYRLVYFVQSDGAITSSNVGPRNESTAGDVDPRFPPMEIVNSGKLVKMDVQGILGTVKETTHITLQGDRTATVTVPNGTYQAVAVSETATRAGRSFRYKTWFAPGIGPVQQQFDVTSGGFPGSSMIELESFSKG
jgi:hypothetical protein